VALWLQAVLQTHVGVQAGVLPRRKQTPPASAACRLLILAGPASM
jgi:hypothetical protein